MFAHRPLFFRLAMRMQREIARLLWPIMEPSHRQYFQDFPLLYAFEVAGGNDLVGDYYEFGVWKGRSFVKAYQQSKLYFNKQTFENMRFVAFDSFQGLPESNAEYLPSGYHKGAFSASRNVFLRACQKAGIPSDQLRVIPGFFSELSEDREDVKQLGASRIAVCYIDCDVYEGCRDALNFITQRLQTGSLLVIDDWNRHHAVPGAGLRRAVAEWLANNPQITLTQLFLSKRALFSVLIKDCDMSPGISSKNG